MVTCQGGSVKPAMIDRCRAKGLDARVMDFLGLDFPAASFDAVYALNCLLHVPAADLDRVLGRLRHVLRPGGLMYLGVHGGERDEEGIFTGDTQPVPRFFAWRTEAGMREAVAAHFGIVRFDVISLDGRGGHFHSLVLRRPADDASTERLRQPTAAPPAPPGAGPCPRGDP